jgi:hypothetical protein
MMTLVVNDFPVTSVKASVASDLFSYLSESDTDGSNYPNLWSLINTGSTPSAQEACDEIDKVFQQVDDEGNEVEIDEFIAPIAEEWRQISEEIRDSTSGPEDSLLITD